ncbi:hypothetical protein ACH42_13920 [Endozoicomonas sp. (ex Bugula neritina AB1)]|nr:hypothetical protein ACH42_13920 [Endozoicomonas sp. (ex Bugula neritina AB1)]
MKINKKIGFSLLVGFFSSLLVEGDELGFSDIIGVEAYLHNTDYSHLQVIDLVSETHMVHPPALSEVVGFHFKGSSLGMDKRNKSQIDYPEFFEFTTGASLDSAPPIQEYQLNILEFAFIAGLNAFFDASSYTSFFNITDLAYNDIQQLANSFQNVTENIEQLIGQQVVHTGYLTTQQAIYVLKKIEKKLRELAEVRGKVLSTDDDNLRRIREDLFSVIGADLSVLMADFREAILSENENIRNNLFFNILYTDSIVSGMDLEIITQFQRNWNELFSDITIIDEGVSVESLIESLIEELKALEQSIQKEETEENSDWSYYKKIVWDSYRVSLKNRIFMLISRTQHTGGARQATDSNTAKEVTEPEDAGENGKSDTPSKTNQTEGKSHSTRIENKPGKTPYPIKKLRKNRGEPEGENTPWEEFSDSTTNSYSLNELISFIVTKLGGLQLSEDREQRINNFIKNLNLTDIEIEKLKKDLEDFFNEEGYRKIIVFSSTELSSYFSEMLNVGRKLSLSIMIANSIEEGKLKKACIINGIGDDNGNKESHQLRESSSWLVETSHNGDKIPNSDEVVNVLEKASFSVLPRVEDREASGGAASNHDISDQFRRDAVRTPITVNFQRVSSLGEGDQVRYLNKYVVFDSKKLKSEVIDRYKSLVHDEKRLLNDGINNSLIDAIKQYVGSEEAKQYIFNILNQNTMNTVRSVIFGGMVDGDTDSPDRFIEIDGILKGFTGYPVYPTNHNQSDSNNQNIEVTIFSNGRISVLYSVYFDQWSPVITTTPKDLLKDNFKLLFEIEFDTTHDLKRIYSSVSYSGQIKEGNHKKAISLIEKAAKAKEKAEKAKPKKTQLAEASFRDLSRAASTGDLLETSCRSELVTSEENTNELRLFERVKGFFSKKGKRNNNNSYKNTLSKSTYNLSSIRNQKK